MRTFADLPDGVLAIIIIVSLLALFGIIIGIVIYVKRHSKTLGVAEEEKVDEETAAQQELDRILVPIEEEDLVEAQAEEEAIKKDE